MSLLAVDDLHVHFVSRDAYGAPHVARALNGVSLHVDAGETLGLVGETGAGKSLTSLAIMGLLRPPARHVGGTIRFDGRELTTLPDAQMNRLRGARIGLVVQSPRTSLDPLARVGAQIARVQTAHRDISTRDAMEKALGLLRAVGIADPAQRLRAWPHELSGGMAQRVLIAMALANDPSLLIADEPTTGLDATVQAQILDLLRDTVAARGLATLLITHDLGVVAHYCDRVAVMFAGHIVEDGRVADVFARPHHPYAVRLIGSAPDRRTPGQAMTPTGPPPDLTALPSGCPYRARCPRAAAPCAQPPPRIDFGNGHGARCFFPEPA